MVGVELVRDRQTKERADRRTRRRGAAAFARGLLVLGAGKNAIRFSPPLVLTREQADIAVRIFDEALTEVSARGGRARIAEQPRSVLGRPDDGGTCVLLGRIDWRGPCSAVAHVARPIALGKSAKISRAANWSAAGTQLLPAAIGAGVENWTSSRGTARRLVFVEVKTRHGARVRRRRGSGARAEAAADDAAVRLDYLVRHRLADWPCRFDVVSIQVNEGGGGRGLSERIRRD